MIMRFSFSVDGNIRFLSHLDFMQIWSRAARRAGIPLAYSQGFNPHPKLAFTPPRGVGMAGRREYGDMELTQDITAKQFIKSFDNMLPQGLAITSARPIEQGTEALMSFVNYAQYSITLPEEADLQDLQQKLDDFLAADVVLHRRNTPKGIKETDLKQSLYTAELCNDELYLELSVGRGGRPSDILQHLGLSPNLCYITRLGLWHKTENGELLMP